MIKIRLSSVNSLNERVDLSYGAVPEDIVQVTVGDMVTYVRYVDLDAAIAAIGTMRPAILTGRNASIDIQVKDGEDPFPF